MARFSQKPGSSFSGLRDLTSFQPLPDSAQSVPLKFLRAAVALWHTSRFGTRTVVQNCTPASPPQVPAPILQSSAAALRDSSATSAPSAAAPVCTDAPPHEILSRQHPFLRSAPHTSPTPDR